MNYFQGLRRRRRQFTTPTSDDDEFSNLSFEIDDEQKEVEGTNETRIFVDDGPMWAPPHGMPPMPPMPPTGNPKPFSLSLDPPGNMVLNPQNPNAPPIYPCGNCRHEVHEHDQAILCESGCNFWFHRVCSGLQEFAFHQLTQAVEAEWVCDTCFKTKDVPPILYAPIVFPKKPLTYMDKNGQICMAVNKAQDAGQTAKEKVTNDHRRGSLFKELHSHIQKLEERLEIQEKEFQNVEMEKTQVEEEFENLTEILKAKEAEFEQINSIRIETEKELVYEKATRKEIEENFQDFLKNYANVTNNKNQQELENLRFELSVEKESRFELNRKLDETEKELNRKLDETEKELNRKFLFQIQGLKQQLAEEEGIRHKMRVEKVSIN